MVCGLYSGGPLLIGFVETGTRLMEEAVAHGSRGDNRTASHGHSGLPRPFQVVHAPAMTARFAIKAIEVAREHRLPQWLAAGERCNGWVIHRLGDREARSNFQHVGVNRWYETGPDSTLPTAKSPSLKVTWAAVRSRRQACTSRLHARTARATTKITSPRKSSGWSPFCCYGRVRRSQSSENT